MRYDNLGEAVLRVLFRSIVDQDASCSHCLQAVLVAADVAGDRDTTAAFLLDRPLSFLGVFMLIKIGNGHFCLFSGKCNGDRSSDPAVPAGDDRDLAGQLSAPRALRIVCCWPGRHLRLDAWLSSLVLERTLLLRHA